MDSKNNHAEMIYWQSYYASSPISKINPNVTSVKIIAIPKRNGRLYDDLSINTSFLPEHTYKLRIKCPNEDCDTRYIDLSDEVWNAVKSETTVDGEKRCHGHSKKYAHNKSSCYDCDIYVQYRIEPVIEKAKSNDS